jgi:hypothetical protein
MTPSPRAPKPCGGSTLGERVETGFSDEELVEAAKRLREGDPEARRAALDLLGEQHERWQVTELGYALSLRASDEALDARLDELRGTPRSGEDGARARRLAGVGEQGRA